MVATVVAVAVSIQFLPRYLTPVLQPALEGLMSTDIRDELESGLRSEPLVDAYFDRFPEELAPAMDRAQAAYDRGGQPALVQETIAIGEELGMNAVARMGPFSTDDMLRRFYDATVNVGRLNRDNNPQLCYAFYYAGIAPHNIDQNVLLEIAAAPGFDQLQNVMADLMSQAGDDVYPVDYLTGQTAMQAANNALGAEGNPEHMRYMMGVRPTNDVEYTEACDLMLSSFNAYGEHLQSAAIIRMMFGSGG